MAVDVRYFGAGEGMKFGGSAQGDKHGPLVWVPCLDLVSAETTLVHEDNPYGEVKRGCLTLSGLVKRIDVVPSKDPTEAPDLFQSSMLHENQAIAGILDMEDAKVTYVGEHRSLLLGCSVSFVSGVLSYSLILQEVTPGANKFRRLGIAVDSVPPDHDVERGRRLKGEYSTLSIT